MGQRYTWSASDTIVDANALWQLLPVSDVVLRILRIWVEPQAAISQSSATMLSILLVRAAEQIGGEGAQTPIPLIPGAAAAGLTIWGYGFSNPTTGLETLGARSFLNTHGLDWMLTPAEMPECAAGTSDSFFVHFRVAPASTVFKFGVIFEEIGG